MQQRPPDRPETTPTVVSTANGTCNIYDFGIVFHNEPDNHIVIRIDDTDHINLIHNKCGKSMEMKMENDIVDKSYGILVNRIYIRCVPCSTEWMRWRKNVLQPDEHQEKIPPVVTQEGL